METLRIGCILDLFWFWVWGEYFVASLHVRVTTLIAFRPPCIRVATLIDLDALFGLGSLP